MKKKLTRLTSAFALAVSLGAGLFASSADAAVISRLSVVSPDSGAWRGIDSVFVVEAAVRTAQLDSNLAVFFWLVNGDDTTAAGEISGGQTNNIADSIATKSNSGAATTAAGFFGQGIVSARQLAFALSGASTVETTNIGNGDSVTVSLKAGVGGADSLIYTWYGKLPATAGTNSTTRVAAFTHDPGGSTDEPFSTTLVTAASQQFKTDGDRPLNGNATFGGGSGGAGNATSIGGVTVSGFTSGSSSKTVLGIGDTIKVTYGLGDQAQAVSVTNDLTLAYSILGKTFNPGVPNAGTGTFALPINEGDFDNITSASVPGATSLFFVDKAGNYSSAGVDDAVPGGVTAAADFLADAKVPLLDAEVVAGDTILPVSNDTLTDGSINSALPTLANDINPLTFNLAEALDSLIITFVGSETVIAIDPAVLNVADPSLGAGSARILDFTNGVVPVANLATTNVDVAEANGANPVNFVGATRGDTLKTKMYSIKLRGTDVAGNIGGELVRTNVYVDVDNISFDRLFPINGGLDTLEEATSKVVFKLSEPADSVLVTYRGLSGPDLNQARTRRLTGSELTNTTTEQELTVDSLKSGTVYELAVRARDLAGNFTVSAIDTFTYDTAFVVPVIAKFVIAADTSLTGLGSPLTVGADLALTLTAQTASGLTAVTYKGNATLKVGTNSLGHGLTATGTGVTDLGGGRIALAGDDWIVGQRTVTLKDTTSRDTLSISIVDSSDTLSPYVGALDSVISVAPAAFSQVLVSAPDTVTQGEDFWVGVRLADSFGNVADGNNLFVASSANKLGVMVPTGNETQALAGLGGFYAKASTFSGEGLIITVRDLPAAFIGNSNAIYVRAADGSGTTVDAPDTLVAEDYAGALGEGDQGGFVMLTFDRSDDHDTLTGYRIFREVIVDYDFDENGAIVHLDEPAARHIPWARVDAVPGVAGNRVVVATLDNDATFWAVAAERGRETTNAKEAFSSAEVVAAPYELMAETIAKSKEAASALGSDAPVFAGLTPEAQAFIANGVVPRLKTVGEGDAFQSVRVLSADAVRAVDNIAPEAVTVVKAIDTPTDQGGSVTVNWNRSPSDRLLSSTVAQAVGLSGNTFTQPGVQGYNVYRKIGDEDFVLVGKVGPGETSFSDVSAFNGVRYTYEVRPFDSDNETAGAQDGAMAFRNRVLDANGQVVLGLFGQDNSVDFDDFFIFADHFGSTKADDKYEAAFDLNVTGLSKDKVDFDDFFVFADFFGRSVEVAGKVLPTLAGLNSDAALGLDAGVALPRIGDEMAVQVNLTNFTEVNGYGFTVNFDPSLLEFVKVATDNNLLGESQLAQPQIVAQEDGQLSIVAFGDAVADGDLGLNLLFRAKDEIEDSYIEISNAELSDGNYGLNQVSSLGFARVQTRPENFALGNNYPNPFNPETTLKYQLPEAADVKLEIYNVVGQVVRTLVADHQNAGRYVVQWDASNDNGQPLSSGMYFYRLQAGGEFQQVKKMLLLK
jgi:hypothetical protein